MTPPLDGRVFARLRRFANLPADLQEDTKQFQAYAEQHKAQLFQIHHAALIKPVFSVKGKTLIDAVIQWLQEREAAAQSATTVVQQAAAAVTSVVGTVVEAVKDALTADDSAKTTTDVPASASAITTPATEAPKPTPAAASPELREHARQISEALVLSGFLTPYKDNEKHLNAATPDHYVRDSDLLIPISRSVTELKTTSVWSVVNGAIHASFLKRKGGVLAHFTHGKDVYVVFNEKTNTAYVFESDLARAPIAELAGETLTVEFDNTHFEFGVRVVLRSGDEKEKPELFNALSKPQQEEFLNAWLNIGAHYREAFNANIENVKSIYELKDRDIIGNEVSFSQYKGKVLLVVNVSSKCGLTPTNYPELTILDERYRELGLEILAFPCNQFSNQEPGTPEEIMEFVKQYNAQYTFFEKGDVNGASARPVFTYLKAKLPGSFGNFVKWNFTKFLVDRNGQPYKRFAPKDLPLSFEDDIKKLLEKPVTDALEAELLGEAEAAVEEMKGESAATETVDVALIEVKTAELPIAASVAPAAT